ncbi:MAG: NAD(P)-dependent oxidoreductase [Mesorhizobium amorphae]|nr:MAG: NAD(P)-dependent oxidoreductase [Mesorhizobium amorphae]
MIGIAGTGRMGTAFVQRLIERGHTVLVWNRTPERAQAALARGAQPAASLAELAQADTIMLSLTDASAVQGVIQGLAESGIAKRLVIDLSTLLPEDSRAAAELVERAGADWVDCPVGGTVAPALKGQLLGMAGGSPEAFARAKPLLEDLCRRVEHLGPAGTGAQMKLALNLPLALYWHTLGEAMAVLKGSGIASDQAIGLLADSSAGPMVLKNRAELVVATLGGADQPGTFDIAGLRKDLDLALRCLKREGAAAPLSETALAAYDRALEEGLGGFDGASLARFLSA